MALQDLTPQLRTRLNRMERVVGWFVLLATALLLVGFAYYVRQMAQRKGWFLEKVPYQTCVSSGAGLKVGDPVKLMGFDVGEITAIIPNDPYDYFNITVHFWVKLNKYNYPGYVWSDSQAKVNAGDLLGGRFLEITKGKSGLPTLWQTNQTLAILRSSLVEELRKERFAELQTADREDAGKKNRAPRGEDDLLAQVWAELKEKAKEHPDHYYTNNLAENIYYLNPLESPAVTDRLQALVGQVEQALPNILGLTNRINAVLNHSATLTSNLNLVAASLQPAATNFALLSAELRGPGALGQWALGPQSMTNLDALLGNANQAVVDVDTNLVALMENFSRTLNNLADITSNLNAQVQANTNMLESISSMVQNTDTLVQGLQKHWLLRSAFKKKK
jgi:ABC-type transporter Mla subunit MlaD